MNIYRISIVFLAFSVLFSACETGEPEVNEEDLVRSVNVTLTELETENFSSYLRLVGSVTTSNDVNISAETGGRIVEFYKREGDTVEAGEQIVKIDDQKLQQEVRRLRAVTEQSRENYERVRQLYEEDGIGSEIETVNARLLYEQNQASLEGLQVDLANTTIRAQFNGEVEDIMFETGEVVAAGQQVLRMISRAGMKIQAGVPARYSESVNPGDEAEIWFDSDPEQVYTVPISFIGGSIDPRNRTFQIDLELPADLDHVKVEMLANVLLRVEYIPDVIVVNEEYIFRKNSQSVVYVAGENESGQLVAVEKVVRPGPSYENRSVITDGLVAGERLITSGSSYLLDQTRITVVEESEVQSISN